MRDVERIKEDVGTFPDRRILVVGDVMLDKNIYGDNIRTNPEAPVPLLEEGEIKNIPGGAANTANNIAHYGANVFLYGIIGGDHTGQEISNLVSDIRGIEPRLTVIEGRKSTRKMRIMGRVATKVAQTVRIDRETREELTYQQAKYMIQSFRNSDLDQAEVYLISDYAKGFINPQISEFLAEQAAKREKLLMVQPKSRNSYLCHKAGLVMLNRKEAKEISGEKDDFAAGRHLADGYNCDVIVTCGKDGMIFFGKDGYSMDVSTKPEEVDDETGAGDTAFATVSLGLASGLDYEESMHVANCASGIVIHKIGTATLTLDELLASLDEK